MAKAVRKGTAVMAEPVEIPDELKNAVMVGTGSKLRKHKQLLAETRRQQRAQRELTMSEARREEMAAIREMKKEIANLKRERSQMKNKNTIKGREQRRSINKRIKELQSCCGGGGGDDERMV